LYTLARPSLHPGKGLSACPTATPHPRREREFKNGGYLGMRAGEYAKYHKLTASFAFCRISLMALLLRCEDFDAAGLVIWKVVL